MSYATPDELAAALRITRRTPDVDAQLQACLDAATAEIDHDLDRADDDPVPEGDALTNRVCLVRAVEWWKSNDAAFGVIGFDQTGSLQVPRDGFSRHAYALTPLKKSWGIA